MFKPETLATLFSHFPDLAFDSTLMSSNILYHLFSESYGLLQE